MGGLLCRAAEVENKTGAVLVITEVVEFERDRKLICRLGPGKGIYIKGRQFINRTCASHIQRSIHVTALIDKTAPCILPANYFAKYGKVSFRLADGKLKCCPEVISDPRRLRFVAGVGKTFVCV